MAKNKISEYSANPANNTDVGGIDIAEGCAPSGINNAIRELMAQLKDQQAGTDGDNFTVGGALTVAGNTTLSNTLTANSSAGTAGQVLASRGSSLSPQWESLNLTATGISNTPAGNISATNVQSAINELDTEKQAALGFTPVQQGGGSGQLSNKVYVGWSSGSGLKAQVDATDLGTIWTGQTTGSSISGNGWQKLPSGLIMQWGYAAASTVLTNVFFPITFPTAVINLQITQAAGSSSGNAASVAALTTSYFNSDYANGSFSKPNIYWFALGY